MGPGNNGAAATSLLTRCKSREDFDSVCLDFIKMYRGEDIDETDWNEDEFMRRDNVVKNDFTSTDEFAREYNCRWHSDYLYILNLSGSDVKTMIRNRIEKEIYVFPNKSVTVLHYGAFVSCVSCLDESLSAFRKKTAKKEMTSKLAVKILTEFNKWRRGDGAYGFTDDPKDYKDCPYTPTEIGKAIDIAVTVMQKGLGNE